jgi:hypothetical protein
LKETVLSHTTSDFASWYIIPVDNKWAALVADIVSTSIQNLDLSYPVVFHRKGSGNWNRLETSL